MATLGLGFALGVRDEGAEGALTGAEDHLDTINKMLDVQGKSAEGASGKIGNMLGAIRNIQLGGISSQLNDLIGSSSNLTTSLESTFISLTKDAKPFAAQLGYTGEQARKLTGDIAGMAHGMKVGADTVGKVEVALRTYGKGAKEVLDEMGMGTKDLIKAEASGLIQSEKFIGMLSDMRNSWKMSAKSVAVLTDQVTAMGQSAGMGAHSMEVMNKTVEVADEVWAKTGKTISEADMADAVRGNMQVAATFVRLGDSGEEAATKAANLFKMIQEESLVQEQMMSGLGGEFGDFFTGLVRDADVGFESLQDLFTADPSDLMKGLVAIRQGLDKQVASGVDGAQEKMTRFNTVVSQAGLSFVLDTGPQTLEVMKEVSAAADGATGALKKTAKEGFSAGWTLGERYDLMLERMTLRFRKLSGVSGKDFLKAQKEGFGKAIKLAEEYKKEGGLMGKAVQTAASTAKFGLAGLFMEIEDGKPKVTELSAAMGLAGKMLGQVSAGLAPLLGFIGPLMPMIAQLGGKFLSLPGMIIAGAGALFLFPEQVEGALNAVLDMLSGTGPQTKLGKSLQGWFNKAWTWMVEHFDAAKDVAVRIANKIASVDWGVVWTTIKSKFSELFSSEGGEALSEEAKKMFSIPTLESIGTWVTDKIIAGIQFLFTDENTGRLVTQMLTSMGKIVDEVFKQLGAKMGDEGGVTGYIGKWLAGDQSGWTKLGIGIAAIWAGPMVLGTALTAMSGAILKGGGSMVAGLLGKKAVGGAAGAAAGPGLLKRGAGFLKKGAVGGAGLVAKGGGALAAAGGGGAAGLATAAGGAAAAGVLGYAIGTGIDKAFSIGGGETLSSRIAGTKSGAQGTRGGAQSYRDMIAAGRISELPPEVRKRLEARRAKKAAPASVTAASSGPGFFAKIAESTQIPDAGPMKVFEKTEKGMKKSMQKVLKTAIADQLPSSMTGEVVDRSSPLANLPERGKSIVRGLTDGIVLEMINLKNDFDSEMDNLAKRGAVAFSFRMRQDLSAAFVGIGESISDSLQTGASTAIDLFLAFAWRRAQAKAEYVSEATVAALESAIVQANEVTAGVSLTQELVIKSKTDRLLTEIRNLTRKNNTQLEAINRATSETVEKLVQLKSSRATNSAPALPTNRRTRG